MQALCNPPWACRMTGPPALSSPRPGQPRTLGSVYWPLPHVNEPAEFRTMSPVTVRQQSGSVLHNMGSWAHGLKYRERNFQMNVPHVVCPAGQTHTYTNHESVQISFRPRLKHYLIHPNIHCWRWHMRCSLLDVYILS